MNPDAFSRGLQMDNVDRAIRSRIMASVPQRDTKPELLLRHALHRRGLRYLLHDKRLVGHPDLLFPKFQVAVFVHGCYWHSHGCRFSTVPATRKDFWEQKFRANRERDARTSTHLLAEGWRVLIVWECAMKPDLAAVERVAATTHEWIIGAARYAEIGVDGALVQNERHFPKPLRRGAPLR